ncbi:putative integrase [Ceratocystis lukuohia]|uniref:Integrase n=1 Tax=Ceratocystis lukuohia TaxID=2019550 RepID=A0ABR4MQW9_9PEZI
MKQYAEIPTVFMGNSALQERLTKKKVPRGLWNVSHWTPDAETQGGLPTQEGAVRGEQAKQGKVTKGAQDVRDEYRQGSAAMADKVEGSATNRSMEGIAAMLEQELSLGVEQEKTGGTDFADFKYRTPSSRNNACEIEQRRIIGLLEKAWPKENQYSGTTNTVSLAWRITTCMMAAGNVRDYCAELVLTTAATDWKSVMIQMEQSTLWTSSSAGVEIADQARLIGTVTKGVATEAHHRVGKVERAHTMLKRAFSVMTKENSGADQALNLQVAVKAVNDTSSLEGLVPTMLVFGAYPRLKSASAPSPSMTRRARAIKMAMAELERFKSNRQVTEALAMRNSLLGFEPPNLYTNMAEQQQTAPLTEEELQRKLNMLNGAFELLNTQYNNLLRDSRLWSPTKLPKLTTTNPDEFNIWFDQVKRVWAIERRRLSDREFATLVYLSAANLARNRIKRILDTNLYDAPGTCDAFLEELQKAFEAPATQEKVLQKIQTIRQGKSKIDDHIQSLQTIRQGKSKIDDHIQKFEDLLSLAQGDNLHSSQKILWFRQSLEPALRRLIQNNLPPTDYNEYKKKAVYASQMLLQQREDDRLPAPLAMGPAPQRNPDAMDWKRARRVSSDQQADRPKAKWVPVEVRKQRKQDGKCLRCGSSNHFVRQCPYGIGPKPRARKATTVPPPEDDALLEDDDNLSEN